MKPNPPLDRHLNARDALDYLEHLLSPDRAAAVEIHLATPCGACRERLRRLALLLGRMQADRPEPVPTEVRLRAVQLFEPRREPAPAGPLRTVLAKLLFDSWAAPLPLAVRRAVGEARRLRWELAEGALEIEIESEADGAVTVRGRLESPDPPLHRIEARARGEAFTAWPDASGSFAFERLPAGELDLAVVGTARLERIPTVLR